MKCANSGKTINNRHNDCVAFREGQTGNEVKGYVGPGSLRYWQGLEESCRIGRTFDRPGKKSAPTEGPGSEDDLGQIGGHLDNYWVQEGQNDTA